MLASDLRETRVDNSVAIEGQRLVVVSNRLPITVERGPNGLAAHRSSGGLVSALDPVLSRRGGTWVGWPGIDLNGEEQIPVTESPYGLTPVPMRTAEVRAFYHGFANATLWPLFHSFPQRTRFDARRWRTYQRINQRFARIAHEVAGADDLVWVHDYHLMLAPLWLRERSPARRLAFFLHIPFPPLDLYRLLPWDRELLHGLLACDLIGFHVEGYVRNFLDSVERLLGARVDRAARLVEYGGRTVRVGAFPLGIDFDGYEERARARAAGERRRSADRAGRGSPRLHQGDSRTAARLRALARTPPRASRAGDPAAARGAEPRRGEGVPPPEATRSTSSSAASTAGSRRRSGPRSTTCIAGPTRTTWSSSTATRTSRWSRRCATG